MAWTNPVADTSGLQVLVPPTRVIPVDLSGNAYTLQGGAVPVIQQSTANVNGTLQNAAGANGNGTALSLLGMASVIITVNMTGFTGTVSFQVSEDGSHYNPLQVQQEGTNNISTFITGATTTGQVIFEGSVAGLQSLQAPVTNFSAGTVTVTAHAIPTTDAPRALNANIAQIPFVLQKAKNVSSGAVASLAQAFASNNVQGNSIVVLCGVGNGTAATVTDSQGNVYTNAVNGANSSTFAAQIFYATNINGGANTVTVTPSASVSVAMQIYEVPGIITTATNALDQNTSATGTSAAPVGSNLSSVSPNSLAFLAVAVGTANQATSVTSGTGWTLDSTQNVGGSPSGLFSLGALSQALGGMTNVQTKATIAGSEPWAVAAATFKPVLLGIEGTVQIGGYNYTNITTATTTVVKVGPGVLHAIVNNTPVLSSSATVYDNTSASAPKIGTITLPATLVGEGPVSATYDAQFTTGLTIVTVSTGDWTILWK